MLELQVNEVRELCKLRGSSEGNALCSVLQREIENCKEQLVSEKDVERVRELQGKAKGFSDLLDALSKINERLDAIKKQQARPHGETAY